MANIKVMSAGAVQSMVTALGDEFARANGHKLDLNFATVGALRERLGAGETTDLAILSESAVAALSKTGLFVASSIKNLGRTRTGVCVREGAAKPDISTPEAFKRALLNAKVVSYTDPKGGGSSGMFFASLLDRLGIAGEVNKTAVLKKRGYEVAQAVADGEADIGSSFISELLTVKGAAVVGPLPAELDNPNTYTGAVMAVSAQREAAAALLAALSDPASRPRWTAAGLDPAF
ncbi:MAG TPA: substrate-binding domain-containing protein [Pseudolabrys sp.]|nr:substrate-binding domain-containing protein [Pseudolabrys sp.]